ncbi:MAG TPA: hypothetical protein VIJ93_09760, partial [bacterium]
MIKLTDRQNKKMLLIGNLVILLGALTLFTTSKINAYIKTNEFIQEAQVQASKAGSQSASVISDVTDNTVATDSVAQIRAQAEAEKV